MTDLRRSSAGAGLRTVAALAAASALALLAACAGTAPPAVVPRPAQGPEPYLIAPMSGYPLAADAEVAARVDDLYRRLRDGEDRELLGAEGRELAAAAPAFHPAEVLLAQVEFLAERYRPVLDLLQPIADQLPDYLACQLLRGRAAERLGEVVVAFEAFRQVSGASELARRRADELRERALEIVGHRLDEALGRGQIEVAETHRAWLERWIGEERTTLEAARRIRAAEGDLEGELEVVCRLVELDPSRELEERCGVLQIEVGDVRVGLEMFEDLAARHPEDASIGEQIERAKFRWRLELLPPRVRELGRKVELERADLATLLYWLAPQVRFSRVVDPPIATDILDHPQYDEILRVVDLGLMRVDETLHRFDPSAPATRGMAFVALLRLLSRAPSQRDFACLGGTEVPLTASSYLVCEKAADCRLVPEAADCLPRAPISGGEALEFFRHALDLLGAGSPPPR